MMKTSSRKYVRVVTDIDDTVKVRVYFDGKTIPFKCTNSLNISSALSYSSSPYEYYYHYVSSSSHPYNCGYYVFVYY